MSDDPIGDALRADAEQARAEIRAAGISCPSCGINMADLPRDHRLVLDHGGVDWLKAERRPASANCAAGDVAPLDGADFETWQAAANVAFYDDFRARVDADLSRELGFDVNGPDPSPRPATGLLDMLSPEAGQ